MMEKIYYYNFPDFPDIPDDSMINIPEPCRYCPNNKNAFCHCILGSPIIT